MGKYSNRVINGKVHKWLQDIGWYPCMLAAEIEIGDSLVFNCGYAYEVVSIVKETSKTVTFEVADKGGKVYQKRIGKTIYWPARQKKEN